MCREIIGKKVLIILADNSGCGASGVYYQETKFPLHALLVDGVKKKTNYIIIHGSSVAQFCMTTGNVKRIAADLSSHCLHFIPKYLCDSHLAKHRQTHTLNFQQSLQKTIYFIVVNQLVGSNFHCCCLCCCNFWCCYCQYCCWSIVVYLHFTTS